MSDGGLHPDTATLILYRFAHDRKSDPCSGVFASNVESLEELENSVGHVGIHANAFVANRDLDAFFGAPRGDLDDGLLTLLPKLDGVSDQVAHHLQQKRPVRDHGRQCLGLDPTAGFLEGELEIGFHYLLGVRSGRWI